MRWVVAFYQRNEPHPCLRGVVNIQKPYRRRATNYHLLAVSKTTKGGISWSKKIDLSI